MRLQSAIFTLGDTLFTPDGAAREGLDKTLSLFKMEGVWPLAHAEWRWPPRGTFSIPSKEGGALARS